MTQRDAGVRPQRVERAVGERPVVRFSGKQSLQGPAVLDGGDNSFTLVALWRREKADGSEVVCEQNSSQLEQGGRAAFLTVPGGESFTAEGPKQQGDYGRNFYATMTFENMPQSDPRRIQMAWMRGWDDYPKDMPVNQQASFPCELTLRRAGDRILMCRSPIREITNIARQNPDAPALELQAIGGQVVFKSLEVYDLRSIWN